MTSMITRSTVFWAWMISRKSPSPYAKFPGIVLSRVKQMKGLMKYLII